MLVVRCWLFTRFFSPLIIGCCLLILHCPRAFPASIILTSSADTTLIEVAPNNNHGAQPFFNSGTTQNGTKNRALLRFDLGSLPTNTVILSASVLLTVVGLPAEPAVFAPFALHRMLHNWNEGTNLAIINIGQGLPAKLGDATWNYSHFNTNSWTAPGCLSGTDFFPFESGSQFIYDLGTTYTHGPTAELATDVQGWIQDPTSNFGWMYLCGEEGAIFTAKRFGSRENSNPDFRPQLILNYLIPPLITRAELSGNTFLLGFQAQAGHNYTIEYRDVLSGGAWQPAINTGLFNSATHVLFLDSATHPARFYRLSAY